MPPTPLIAALAGMRVSSMLSIPRRVSMLAYLYFLVKVRNPDAFYERLKARILWLTSQPRLLVRRLVNLLKTLLYGKKQRKALLIGIQQVAEPPYEEPVPVITTTTPGDGGGDASSLMPGRPRAMKKMGAKKPKPKAKAKKPKPPSPTPTEQAPLRGPHHDVRSMQALLIDKYGYDPDDIVVLIDDGDPTLPQPTRATILAQIQHLVKDVKDGDKVFFHYAGHAGQEDTEDIEEEDGKNEYILACDGLSIIDNELKAEIVDPLQNVQCTLTAVLDCCHSGSLLDLPHIHCNDVYVPWLNRSPRRTKSFWANRTRSPDMDMVTPSESAADPELAPPILDMPILITPREDRPKPTSLVINTSSCYPTPPATNESRQPSPNIRIPAIGVTDASPVDGECDASTYVSPERYMEESPVARYCEGKCREDPLVRFRIATARPGVQVTCISAAKDNELAWEDGEGKSMTQYLVHNLNSMSKPTLHNLMTLISHDIHSYYVSDLHQRARAYKKKMNAVNHGHPSDNAMAKTAEMHNFQNPQLSSLLPMNMEQVFDP